MFNRALASLERTWRVIATAIAFMCFGLGGLVLGICFFPALNFFVRENDNRTRVARFAVHLNFKFFILLMRQLGILRFEIEGVEKLSRPSLLILANHPTLIDVVHLVSLIPNADCVVKAGLAKNIFTRGPVRATNYICNDSGVGLIEDCIASLKNGSSLVIFPEGTRTPVNGEMKLQRGAANIAVRGQCNITPVSISCAPLSLTKGLAWWKVPAKPMKFIIKVHNDIEISPFIEQASGESALAARYLTDYLHLYFLEKRRTHAVT